MDLVLNKPRFCGFEDSTGDAMAPLASLRIACMGLKPLC